MKRSLILILTALLFLGCQQKGNRISSPDGKIRVVQYYDREDCYLPFITISVDKKPLILVGGMGLDIAPDSCLFHPDTVEYLPQVDTVWNLPWGENKVVHECYNEMVVRMKRESNSLSVRIRVFDNGVAFRYEYQLALLNDSTYGRLLGDKTYYRFPSDGVCWSIPANFESYEFAYREQPLSQTTDANTPSPSA